MPRMAGFEPVEGAGAISVATTSTAVVGTNSNRTALVVVNDSDTVIYLALAVPAVVGRGIRLNPAGGCWTTGPGECWVGTVNAVADVGSIPGPKNLCYVEY